MKVFRIVIPILVISCPVFARAASSSQSAAEDCRLAQQFLTEGRYQQAREASERALRLDPESVEAESLAGQAELALGNLDAAQKHLKRALELKPGYTEAVRALGVVFLKQRLYQNAQRQFESVLASKPDDFVSRYSLGISLLLQGQPAIALEQFQKAYQLNNSNPALLAAMIETYLKLNRKADASSTLAEIDRRLGDRYSERMQIAALLVNEKAYDLAIEEFERLREAHPDSSELNYDLALAYHRAGKEAQAAALLKKLLAQKADADLENLLGDVEEKAGNHAAALTAFRRAAELAPQNEDYRFDYAQSLQSHWDLPEALRVFETGTRDFPHSAKMWLGLGATYYLAGRYKESTQILLQAAKVAPDSPEVFALLGPVYDAAGSFQEAIAELFSRYLSGNPPDAAAHYYYGKILLEKSRQGRPESLRESRRQLEAAIKLDPSLAEAHTELGILLEGQGQIQAAREELEKAVHLDPASTTAYYNLAQVYRRLGKTAQAQEALRKFQQLKASQKKSMDQEDMEKFLVRAKEKKP